jgi:hypothetical protein
MTTSQLSHLNNRLARDLGRTPYGDPQMKWVHSDHLQHPMRVPGYDFVPTPGGLVQAAPKYELRPMNPTLDHQWVICRWEAPISEQEWRDAFGYQMEWPSHGDYYPTNVALPQGVEPNDTWTDRVIEAERERRSKSLADHANAIQRGMERNERSVRSRRNDIIEDAIPAFGNVPGTKGVASYPSVRQETL